MMPKPTPRPAYESAIVLPAEVATAVGLSVNAYQQATIETDTLDPGSFEMPILGLFGEIGSLLSALKKKQRDKAAFAQYDAAILEELGDVLWYFTAIARRAKLVLSVLAERVLREVSDWDVADQDASVTFGGIQARLQKSMPAGDFGTRLIELAGRTGDFLNDFGADRFASNRDRLSAHLVEILRSLFVAAAAAQVTIEDAAYGNLLKTFSRWPPTGAGIYPPLTDVLMPRNERLPRTFTVFFEEHDLNGKVYVLQKCNGVIIGDRLTDNKTEKDDYRFHDVFHIAYAVHLGWSPVLRALFRVKRKSDPELDENQDGARAILIEEGVSTFIFGRGVDRGLFEKVPTVDYDLLKSIQELVRGYEVERCALWQWEKAIMDGFSVFRELKKHRKGYVDADLNAHTLKFREGEDEDDGERKDAH